MFLLGEIASLVTASLWSFSSIIFTEASRRIGSQQLNLNRLITAMILLFLALVISGISFNANTQQLFFLMISGLTGLVFGDGFLFKSFQMIGARLSMLIMSSVPGITTLIGYTFLNEKLSLTGLLGIIITVAGIAIVVYERNDTSINGVSINYKGVFYGFMGALGQAVGLVFAKFAFNSGEINSFLATFIRITSAVIVFLPFMLLIGKYKNPVKLYKKDNKSLLFTIAGSIIGPFLGITFSLIAIKNTEVGIASTLMATVPIMMLPIVRIIYKEKITIKSLIGSVIAISGVAIIFLRPL